MIRILFCRFGEPRMLRNGRGAVPRWWLLPRGGWWGGGNAPTLHTYWPHWPRTGWRVTTEALRIIWTRIRKYVECDTSIIEGLTLTVVLFSPHAFSSPFLSTSIHVINHNLRAQKTRSSDGAGLAQGIHGLDHSDLHRDVRQDALSQDSSPL